MSWSYIIFLIALLPASFAALRYCIQMYQQNSYRPERFRRWLKDGNILSFRRMALLLAAVLAFFPLTVWGASAILLIYAVVELRRKYKIKIAYTPRVLRLFGTSYLLLACAVGLPLLFSGLSDVVVTLLAASVSGLLALVELPVLLAALLNSPIEKGINRWYYNDAKKLLASRKDLLVIGVTGSFGKTSTKNALYRILSEKYNVLVTPGNFNTLLGVIRTVREQLKPFHQVFIVEMGAKQRGDIQEICDLVHPSIGIVTSVGEMHLETFKTLRNIQDTKFELIRSLPADGLGVINADSAGVAGYDYSDVACPVLRYGMESPDLDYRASDLKYSSQGLAFSISKNDFEMSLLGTGNVLNVTAAVAVADHIGIPTTVQKNAVAKLRPVLHRLSMRNAGGFTVLDDAYNSNPEGAKMALDVLSRFNLADGARRIVITPGFVEMGERQAEANRAFGRRIAEVADIAVIVNKLNREALVGGLKDAGFPAGRLVEADSLAQASAFLRANTKVGDILLYENDLPDTFK